MKILICKSTLELRKKNAMAEWYVRPRVYRNLGSTVYEYQ
jgi:hypothetical protein